MTKIASNLQIDSARLWDTIHETAKFGATPKGGVRRLTLGPEDKQVRDWFRSACEAAGLEVHVDTLGSMFGLRKGRDMSKAPVGLGSHLDTQPTGGKYDGVLGTLAARMGDSFREAGLGFGWSWPVAAQVKLPAFVPPLMRIDYIWHSPQWRTVTASQGPTLGSDHLPLYATLELQANK